MTTNATRFVTGKGAARAEPGLCGLPTVVSSLEVIPMGDGWLARHVWDVVDPGTSWPAWTWHMKGECLVLVCASQRAIEVRQ